MKDSEDLLTFAFKPYAEWLCDLLKVKSGEKVLDVGCGKGISTLVALDKVLSDGYVVGVDYDYEVIKRLQSNFSKEENVKFLVSQAEKIDSCLGKEEFDVVMSNYSFHLFSDMAKAMKHMLNVLKPEGRLGITVPGSEHVIEFRKMIMSILRKLGSLERFAEYGPLVMDKEKITNFAEKLKGQVEDYKIFEKKLIVEMENVQKYVKHIEARNAKKRILERIPEHLQEEFWGEIQSHLNQIYGTQKVRMTLHGLALILQKGAAPR